MFSKPSTVTCYHGTVLPNETLWWVVFDIFGRSGQGIDAVMTVA